MKRWIFFLPAAVFLLAVRPVAAETYGLQSTGSFALGGIGVAGTMSAGERALREVLKNQDAVARLEALLPSASPAGKLYALLVCEFAIARRTNVRWQSAGRPMRRWKPRAVACSAANRFGIW